MSLPPITALDLKELHDDLQQRIREELDTFVGVKMTPDLVDRLKTAVGAQIHMFLQETGFEKSELDFSFDITLDQGNVSLSLVAKGGLAQQFVEAVHFGTERVDPDERAGLRPFDPLWSDALPDGEEPLYEGVPPVAKPNPSWETPFDPLWSLSVGEE